MDKKVLIVTGASKGMGFQIVLKALQAGYAVVGTSRSAEKLEAQVKDAMGAAQGIYSASKAAVIMIGEALSEEVAPFNIQVTSICPGGVRTDFLDNSSMKRPEKQIAEYHVAAQTMRSLDRLNHNQSGDPALVADVILEVASMKQPPTRLYLGGSALSALQYKVNSIIADANRYVALSESIDN